jgi:hypothetical protein
LQQQLFFDDSRATVKKKTTKTAAANTSHNQKWIYQLTTERHRWQPPGAGPLFIYDESRVTVKTKTTTAAAANTSHNCKWIYLLKTERLRWQPAAAVPFFIFRKLHSQLSRGSGATSSSRNLFWVEIAGTTTVLQRQHIVNNLLFDFSVALYIANEHMAIAVASLPFLGDWKILWQH